MTLLAKSADVTGSAETLFDHSIHVVQMARELYYRLPASAQIDANLLRDLENAAVIHDIGKAAVGFQAMLLQQQPNWSGWRHEVLSAGFASTLNLPEEVVFAVLTHHRRIPDELGLDNKGRLRFWDGVPEGWEPIRKEFEANRMAVRELWIQLTGHLNRPGLLSGIDTPLEGLLINPAWRRPRNQIRSITAAQRKRASLLRGLLISADHLASDKVDLPAAVDLKQFQPKFTLRPFQQRAAIAKNVILRAPTGSGKTEAALTWAAFNQPPNGRLFYTLPVTAALNAMHARLEKELPEQKASIGLLHGRAAHHLFQAMEKDRRSAKSNARSAIARPTRP